MSENTEIQVVQILGLERDVLEDLTLRIHPRLVRGAVQQGMDTRSVQSEIIGLDPDGKCGLEIVLPIGYSKDAIDEALADAIKDFGESSSFSPDDLSNLAYFHAVGKTIVPLMQADIREQVGVGGERGI
ncbi:MAG: hypothetical protein U0R17_07010 [Acidimicrobiia bacterium]